jgi:hypothetical protein
MYIGFERPKPQTPCSCMRPVYSGLILRSERSTWDPTGTEWGDPASNALGMSA